jgi:hypothetical protein
MTPPRSPYSPTLSIYMSRCVNPCLSDQAGTFLFVASLTENNSPNKNSNPLQETGNDREKKEYCRIGEQGNGACNSERI